MQFLYLTNRGVWKFCLVLLLVFIPSSVSALSRVDELKNQINDKSSQIDEIEREIAKYKEQLLEVGAEKQTLQKAISQLNIARKKLLSDIQLTEQRISAASLSIEKLSLEIDDKERRIQNNNNALAETIRRIHESDNRSLVEVVLSYNNLSEFWEEIEEIQRFQNIVKDDLETLRILREELEGKKGDLESERSNLSEFNSELYNQKLVVDTNKKEKDNLLAVTKNEETAYQALLKEKQEAKDQFEKDIRDLESQLQFILDPNSIPSAGSSVLAWPLDNVYITQHFGATVEAKRLYVSGTHNGIDLRAQSPEPVRAALGGQVQAINIQVASMCQYGKWVLVKHANGLTTLYAHLSLVSVDAGDSVSTGQIIGYSGETGYALGPHLHFTVYASAAVKFTDYTCKSSGITLTIPVSAPSGYLDPLSYL